MRKIISVIILILLFVIALFCSCIYIPSGVVPEPQQNSNSSVVFNSQNESEESSVPQSSAVDISSSYTVKNPYEESKTQQNGEVLPESNYVNEQSELTIPESSGAFSEDNSRSEKTTKFLFNIYEKAFEKSGEMDSYNITTAEQYNCPSAGLDESTLFTNIYDAATDCFSYSFYNKIYGKPSLIEAYGNEKGQVFIKDNGKIYVGSRNAILIDLPPFFEFDINNITSSKIGFSLSRTVVSFTIKSDEINNKLIELWSPVVGKGLNDYTAEVTGIDVTAIIDNNGYLISKTLKFTLTATDSNRDIEQNILTAEQCVEYASPSNCKPPVLFDFAAKLMEADDYNPDM